MSGVEMLRAKMGPLLRSDDEARQMLRMLAMNPAVQQFARMFPTPPASDDKEREQDRD